MAPVPLWATAGPRGHARRRVRVARRCKAALLPGVVAGDTVLTAALTDVAGDIAVGGTGPAVGRRQVRTPTGWSCRAPPLPSPPPMWPTGSSSRRPSTAAWSSPWSIPTAPGVTHGAGRHHQPRDPSPPPPRRRDGRRPTTCWPAGIPTAGPRGADVDAQSGLDRAVRPPGGGDRGRRGPDRRLPQHPGAVRPPAVDLPGDHAAGGRRGHRHRVDPGHHVAGGVAAGPRAGRRRWR